MSHDEDPLDLLEDDGDGVNEMCHLFDEDSKKGTPNGPHQRTGCAVAFLLVGTSFISAGVLLSKYLI